MTAATSLAGPLIVSAGLALLVAIAGGLLTDIGSWYYALKVPSWKPPDWAFGPVWTTIFTLCAISAALAWRDAGEEGLRTRVVTLFVVNAVLNIAWSWLFFTLKRPDWALIEVAALWLSVLALIIGLWGISRTASLLLVPYLAWVSVAATLNQSIVRMNGPFT
jgi:tryptophan-rich sensory protein